MINNTVIVTRCKLYLSFFSSAIYRKSLRFFRAEISSDEFQICPATMLRSYSSVGRTAGGAKSAVRTYYKVLRTCRRRRPAKEHTPPSQTSSSSNVSAKNRDRNAKQTPTFLAPREARVRARGMCSCHDTCSRVQLRHAVFRVEMLLPH